MRQHDRFSLRDSTIMTLHFPFNPDTDARINVAVTNAPYTATSHAAVATTKYSGVERGSVVQYRPERTVDARPGGADQKAELK
jgi:hypothetical protein